MNRVDELTLKLADGTLTESEREELESLLAADPEGARRHFDLLDLEAALRGAGEPPDVVEATMARLDATVTDTLIRRIAELPAPPWARRPARRRRLLVAAGAAASVAAAVLAAVTFLIRPPGGTGAAGVRLVVVRGEAMVQGIDGPARAAAAGLDLQGDQVLSAVGESSAAAAEYADRTRLTIAGDGRVRFRDTSDGGKAVVCLAGTLQVDVTPQPPGRPLVVDTPHAHIEVEGTRFTVSVIPASSRVDVDEGWVHVSRPGGGVAVRIGAGRYAVASPGGTLRIRTRPGSGLGRIRPLRIEAAVDRACRWLLEQESAIGEVVLYAPRRNNPPRRTYVDLAALALAESDLVAAEHPFVAALVDRMLADDLASTYATALRAMALARLDPEKYRGALARCAQFLVDSQCENGQWDYGVMIPIGEPGAVVAKRRKGLPNGDNSATAYAALGLLACARAGIRFDPEPFARARRFLVANQNPDGGWGYNNGGVYDPKGGGKYTSDASYGSMTAATVVSLCVFNHLLGRDVASDPACRRGVEWLAANYRSDQNPRKTPGFGYTHYLVSVGYAGAFLGIESLGGHDWYAEACEALLASQRPSGEWLFEPPGFMAVERREIIDTCLAIRFLRQGEPPLGR
jgi:ferric-dicitrate binding protein FerR (iron transport regulator)